MADEERRPAPETTARAELKKALGRFRSDSPLDIMELLQTFSDHALGTAVFRVDDACILIIQYGTATLVEAGAPNVFSALVSDSSPEIAMAVLDMKDDLGRPYYTAKSFLAAGIRLRDFTKYQREDIIVKAITLAAPPRVLEIMATHEGRVADALENEPSAQGYLDFVSGVDWSFFVHAALYYSTHGLRFFMRSGVKFGWRALEWAALRDIERFKLFVDAMPREANLYNALKHVSGMGRIAHMELLLKTPGLDINGRDAAARTALMDAVVGLSFEAAKLLVGRGADLTLKDKDGNNVLHHAARVGNVAFVQLLRDTRPAEMRRIQHETNKMDEIPMQIAAATNNLAMVAVLRDISPLEIVDSDDEEGPARGTVGKKGGGGGGGGVKKPRIRGNIPRK